MENSGWGRGKGHEEQPQGDLPGGTQNQIIPRLLGGHPHFFSVADHKKIKNLSGGIA